MILSLSVAGILPTIEAYGVLLTNTISAILAWGAFGYVPYFTQSCFVAGRVMISCVFDFGRLLWFTIRYGDRLRAVVDVGFSTADNN